MTPPRLHWPGSRATHLAPVLVVSTLVLGCGPSESPFDLWDMRVGMPMATLDSISLHDQLARFTCTRAAGSFRRCSVPLRGSPGRMDALVDSADQVVVLTFSTGADRLQGDLRQLVGLIEASKQLVESWDRVVDPVTTGMPLEGQTDTWHAGRGRWTARIEWWATHQPQTITVTDEEALGTYREAAATSAEATRTGSSSAEGNVADGPAREELRRLVVAQRAYRARSGTYATELGALHFIPRSGVVVEIRGARSAGWWAEVQVDGDRACAVWEGVPPPPEDGRVLGGTAGEPDCE